MILMPGCFGGYGARERSCVNEEAEDEAMRPLYHRSNWEE